MNNKINKDSIPKEVIKTGQALIEAGFEAFLVGGCVRDLLINRPPKDWDLTTNATPEEIQKVFIDSFYENNFGTVGVKTENEDNKVIEITPYRLETGYTDKRHPDEVKFSQNIDDDLQRRDFTINAMAYDLNKGQLKDIYNGQKDLESCLIRAVGDPDKRFGEDALRMLRAIRFSAELGFMIEQETAESIMNNANLMKHVSRERIGDELTKLIMSKSPALGLGLAEKLHILSHILPIFMDSVGSKQNKQAHKYDVWEHSIRTLQHAADKDLSLEIRLAALFHDVAKPITKREEGGVTTFYNHEVVGAKVARETLRELAFPKEVVSQVEKLVRYHMFFSDTDEITHSAVRRLVSKVGQDSIWDLINLRKCDRIGSGRPKEEPYRLRKFQAMIDEVMRDPVSVSMLKIDGNDLISRFHVEPGPKIGWILHALFEDVLEEPKNNNEMFLVKRIEKLLKLSVEELQKEGEKGKDVMNEKEAEEVSKIRKGRFVE
jgi:tRNA nucleotidyltransferase (CCA-adding enzyme)